MCIYTEIDKPVNIVYHIVYIYIYIYTVYCIPLDNMANVNIVYICLYIYTYI